MEKSRLKGWGKRLCIGTLIAGVIGCYLIAKRSDEANQYEATWRQNAQNCDSLAQIASVEYRKIPEDTVKPNISQIDKVGGYKK
jgi:hypothetical protein